MDWYPLDKNNTAREAVQTYATNAGYSQLINEPAHCVNGSSSCIDLVFTSNTNLVTDFGLDPALYKTCHHNLVFGKINFNIPLPAPIYRHYKSANVKMIQKAIIDFSWKQVFSNNSVNENVRFFAKTLKNRFSYYIPNGRVKINYKKPKWTTKG